jgi:hypothetical protein
MFFSSAPTLLFLLGGTLVHGSPLPPASASDLPNGLAHSTTSGHVTFKEVSPLPMDQRRALYNVTDTSWGSSLNKRDMAGNLNINVDGQVCEVYHTATTGTCQALVNDWTPLATVMTDQMFNRLNGGGFEPGNPYEVIYTTSSGFASQLEVEIGVQPMAQSQSRILMDVLLQANLAVYSATSQQGFGYVAFSGSLWDIPFRAFWYYQNFRASINPERLCDGSLMPTPPF